MHENISPDQALEFSRFVEWAFGAIIAGGAAYSTRFLSQISRSIAELNKQVSVIIERTAWHEKTITRHDERISKLEGRPIQD